MHSFQYEYICNRLLKLYYLWEIKGANTINTYLSYPGTQYLLQYEFLRMYRLLAAFLFPEYFMLKYILMKQLLHYYLV